MKLAEVCIRVITSHALGDDLTEHIHWIGDCTRQNGSTKTTQLMVESALILKGFFQHVD